MTVRDESVAMRTPWECDQGGALQEMSSADGGHSAADYPYPPWTGHQLGS
jgi:hypothetical protein